MRVNKRVARARNHEATSRSRTPVEVEPNLIRGEHQPTPTALEPLVEDLHKAALVAVAATAVVAPPMAPAEEAVVVVIVEAEATRIAMPPATNVVVMTPATGSTRYAPLRRLPMLATAMASPPTPHDFALCFFPRSSSLSGSPITTQSKIQFSASGAMPWPLRTLVATTTQSASTSPSAWTRLHSHGSSRSTRTRSMSGTS
jgi:hypothetical protein